MPLLTAAQFVWRHFRLPYGASHEAVFAVVMTVVSLIAAIAVHLLCERPVTQWLRRRTAHL
jgi:peptidoglycan/LPS O-acetylase OafA/YrhL